MRRFTYSFTLPLILFLATVSSAQAPATNKNNAKVAGRINIEGKPAMGVRVLLKKKGTSDSGSNPTEVSTLTVITNASGLYEITNLIAGSYNISVYAPAYLIEGENRWSYETGKAFDLGEGEEVENLNFSLIHGGVITGKITDEDGKPVILEGVGAFRLDQQGKPDKSAAGQMLTWQTDDRGVYRIYGLDAGRYIVGAGASNDEVIQPIGYRGLYKRTYYPEATDVANAKIIEVKQGLAVENVDIKLARPAKRYTASGRVIDTETGKPLSDITIGCEFAKAAGSSFRMSDLTTNSRGEFNIEGLSPNAYIAYVYNPGETDLLAKPINFDIDDSDVTGLEIKMTRGASISGIASVEGTANPAVLSRLSQIPLRAESTSQDTAMLMMLLMQGGGVGTIKPDGTWRIGGVRPGKTRLVAMPPPELKGLMLTRIERNGFELNDFDVTQGEQIKGVRLVFTYGTSVLTGHVEIRGETQPFNAQLTVRVVREGASAVEWWLSKQTNVDARGQFTIEGLSQGNYKVYLLAFPNDGNSEIKFPKIEQSVNIPDDGRKEITLVLDLSKPEL